jgi:hypothetical protein
VNKPVYSIDAPDQQRLKLARTEIEAVLRKYDVAGVAVLHTPGMAEWFYDMRPSYSCAWVDESAQILRMKSKLTDYGGDREAQLREQAQTANMVASFAGELSRAASMFADIQRVVDSAARVAEHTGPVFTPDPNSQDRH